MLLFLLTFAVQLFYIFLPFEVSHSNIAAGLHVTPQEVCRRRVLVLPFMHLHCAVVVLFTTPSSSSTRPPSCLRLPRAVGFVGDASVADGPCGVGKISYVVAPISEFHNRVITVLQFYVAASRLCRVCR